MKRLGQNPVFLKMCTTKPENGQNAVEKLGYFFPPRLQNLTQHFSTKW